MFTKDKRPQRADQPKSSLKNRFVAVNQDKLRRLRDNLTTRQRDLVDVLPLLFQTNQRRLPGYVSKDTPVGICDYVPTRQALQAAQRLALQYREEQPAQKLPAIKGLYLMGSPGTVGYSKTSDLDIWLVHDPALEDTDISTLKAKARKIETHASNIGLEMHFFVFDAVRFRSGETLSLSGESSGSSQHYLLLDEFYRSGLVLAGLKPLWWCVPASEEHRYGQYTQEALETNQLVEQDYVDFGGLANIPADEFLGATVWHLYKSIDSPYKSVLKLLLVETYASDYPAGQLLSHRYKKAIAEGEVSLTDLDPYILMYRRVEEYLQGKGDSARLDLIRRSFYIKTNVQLSKAKESRVPDWQRETLSEMALSWDWNKADIHHLDNRRDWKIPFALKERRILIKALQKSYTALSDFARSHGQDQKITEADLNVLGRKLYAAFEKKPSKIDIITRGICPNPTEDNLSLHCITEPSGRQRWSLYSGSVTPTEAKKTKPLLRARALAELLAWCHFNHLVDNNTHWRIYDQKQRLSIIDLRKAIDTINGVYPGGEIKAARSAALGTTPRPLAALLLINIGVDPLAGKV
ncbi:MAG: class I adenylate cyclase, partial [Gammaproteobacteria bacterium]|nr:class I adenylate cyclase [Gammaproteobacteria bacterium]